MPKNSHPITEYEQIFNLVGRLDDDLKAGRVYFFRRTSGEPLECLGQVVQTILEDDLISHAPSEFTSPEARNGRSAL